MPLIKWRDSYATGIKEMDDEHREIIDIINTLYEMIRDKKNYDELKNVYERLYNYSLNHFSFMQMSSQWELKVILPTVIL